MPSAVEYPPDHALCLRCGYALRGLPSARCPECGTEFDPADGRTMYFGPRGRVWLARLIDALKGPIHARLRTMAVVGSAMILWGAAWLPGGRVVEFTGWILLSLATVYVLPRRFIRVVIRCWTLMPPFARPASEQYSRRQVLLIVLAATTPFYFWPLRLNMLLQWSILENFSQYSYFQAPMLDPPPAPRMMGSFVLTRVDPEPHGVTVRVAFAGSMYWAMDNSGYSLDLNYALRDTLWYLDWLLPPQIGRCFVEPDYSIAKR